MFARCVICCTEKHAAQPERSFHRFPKNEMMKSKWIEAIESETPCTSGMICSDHFLPEDFCEPVGYGYVPKRLLQENAVPKLKIVGLSMTDVRLQGDNIKDDVEQRVVVHSLDCGEKENMYYNGEDVENSMIKQPEIESFDFFTQSSETLNCGNENMTLSCDSENLTLSCLNENITLSCLNEFIPLSCAKEFIPLSCGNEFIPLNCSQKNIRLNCGNENITDPDLKRIISGNMDIIDLNQEFNDPVAELKLTSQKKKDVLETNLKRVIIKMPDIGLRSFTEDDFTSSLAWKIFVKFILHNRKENSSLRHKCNRLQQKVDSYQKMFDILRRGGRIRMESSLK